MMAWPTSRPPSVLSLSCGDASAVLVPQLGPPEDLIWGRPARMKLWRAPNGARAAGPAVQELAAPRSRRPAHSAWPGSSGLVALPSAAPAAPAAAGSRGRSGPSDASSGSRSRDGSSWPGRQLRRWPTRPPSRRMRRHSASGQDGGWERRDSASTSRDAEAGGAGPGCRPAGRGRRTPRPGLTGVDRRRRHPAIGNQHTARGEITRSG
jgi:hypothetical protein